MESSAEGQVLPELFQEIVRNVTKMNGLRRCRQRLQRYSTVHLIRQREGGQESEKDHIGKKKTYKRTVE